MESHDYQLISEDIVLEADACLLWQVSRDMYMTPRQDLHLRGADAGG